MILIQPENSEMTPGLTLVWTRPSQLFQTSQQLNIRTLGNFLLRQYDWGSKACKMFGEQWYMMKTVLLDHLIRNRLQNSIWCFEIQFAIWVLDPDGYQFVGKTSITNLRMIKLLHIFHCERLIFWYAPTFLILSDFFDTADSLWLHRYSLTFLKSKPCAF